MQANPLRFTYYVAVRIPFTITYIYYYEFVRRLKSARVRPSTNSPTADLAKEALSAKHAVPTVEETLVESASVLLEIYNVT